MERTRKEDRERLIDRERERKRGKQRREREEEREREGNRNDGTRIPGPAEKSWARSPSQH